MTNLVRHSTLEWATTIQSVPHRFDIDVFDSIDESGVSSAPVVLNLNGIGEGTFSASVAPRMLGENVISPLLPFRGELELTPVNIERIAAEVPELVAVSGLHRVNEARRLHRLDEQSEDLATVAMIARSQGGAPGIRAATSNPDLFERTALIMPFGLNRDDLGSTEKQRRYRSLMRLGFAAARANPFDFGNARSTMEVASFMTKAFLDGTLLPSLDAALTFDLTDELKEHAEDHDVMVFTGARDPLFPTTELNRNLAGSNVGIRELPGTHATPGSRTGKKHLAAAYEWVTNDTAQAA